MSCIGFSLRVERCPTKAGAAWRGSRRSSMVSRQKPARRSSRMPDAVESPKAIAHDKYERLVKAAQAEATIKVAVAHPCDEVSLESAIEAARMQLIEPILVGPAQRIRAVAQRAGLDIGGMAIVDAEHSHDSAAKA